MSDEEAYWHGCRDKLRYDSNASAKDALLSIRKRRNVSRPDNINLYLCKFCQGWHLGHKNTMPRKQKRIQLALPKSHEVQPRKQHAPQRPAFNDPLPPIIPGTLNLGELLKELL